MLVKFFIIQKGVFSTFRRFINGYEMIIKSSTYFGDDLYLTMSGTLVVASNSDQISIF